VCSVRSNRQDRSFLCFGITVLVLAFAVAIPVGLAGAVESSSVVASTLPVPSDAGPFPRAVAKGVSCPSAGKCTAIGDYQDQIGITHSMTLNLTAGTWTAAQMFAPNNAPDYTFSELNAVSCVSVGNCVAVGDYRISTAQTEGYYAVESAGVWSRGLELPLPADVDTNPADTAFVSASCVPGGTTCQLLGEYITDAIPQTVHSVIDTYVFGSGLTGSPIEIAQLSGKNGIELGSISCTTSSACVAVGAETSAVTQEAAYVEENSGVWGTPVDVINPAGARVPSEYLSSVSCVSTGNCVALGGFVDDRANLFAETYTEVGGTWRVPVEIGEPSNLGDPFADAVSCVSTVNSCTIVGALSDVNGSLHAASAQMTSGHWGQLAPATVPSGSITDHELLGVSCQPGVQCTAVGYYNVNTVTRDTRAMAATWVVGVPPGPITGLRNTGKTSTSATVAWTAPSNFGSGFDHYEITARVDGASPKDEGPSVSTTAVVSKLSPGTTYQISVFTVASDGQTSAPVMVRVSLPPIAPSPPRITHVVGLHDGLRISWLPPKATGGAPITAYRARAICGGSIHEGRFPDSARHGMLDGLPAGRTCTVRLSASNRAGSSPPSAPVKGVPLG
jgi:hypothetical protein